MSSYDPAAHDWRALRGAAMPGGLGIPWAKIRRSMVLRPAHRPEHANPAGVVHGGVLMAFADHGLSLLAWEAAERTLCTTIQLNTHFLDAIHPGEFIELRGEVTRRTRGLVFMRGVIGVRNEHKMRDVGAIDGIWRVLRPR